MPKKKGEDESSKQVEELLSAAQDHMLLDLSIGSHSTRHTSSLDGDLLRRFEDLKKPSSSSAPNRISPLPEKTAKTKEPVAVSGGEVDDELNRALGADLAARFAALKGISSSPASSGESLSTPEKLHAEKEEDEDDDDVDEDGVSKTEVDKLIQWAMDAACLDPSVGSDDDADDDDEAKDEDDERVRTDQSKKHKGKNKGKR